MNVRCASEAGGDMEAFLSFVVADMPGWSVTLVDGRQVSVSHVVDIRLSNEDPYRDILMDASQQLSGVSEIVVIPSAQSLHVRYPTVNGQ